MADEPAPRRRSWSRRRSVSEISLPGEYLERLEQKRKQLDESIHKYIAAKEREYKTFEKDLKLEHKLSQGQDGANALPGSPLKSMAAEQEHAHDQSRALASQRIAAVDALSIPANSSASITEAPKDAQVTAGGRDPYLEGLFTPAYLSALEARGEAPPLERASSDPPRSNASDIVREHVGFERANSDSFEHEKLKRPSMQLLLAQRTSSSGSSADGRLASAMKSPTHRAKHKRVSLAVGDAIVAPSDSVPPALSHNSTPSHSRKRSHVQGREYPLLTKRQPGEPDGQQVAFGGAPSPLADELVMDAVTIDETSLSTLPPAAVASTTARDAAPRTSTSALTNKIDADGDLFDLEDESKLESDNDAIDTDTDDEDVVIGRIKSTEPPPSPPIRARYDSTEGIIPEPADPNADSAVPYLAFGPRSAAAPLEPGFRRPSVIHDPVYKGADYEAAERNAVDNDVYGSSANRPARSWGTPGSLGESYMAQHAEEMMRSRLARQQAQVKS